MNNSIYIRRSRKLYIDKEGNLLPDDYLFNLLKNIEGLGYTFSIELIEVVKTLSIDNLKVFYQQLVSDLKENTGAYVEFNPMYPNFPDQVIQASEEELYSNAFIHYLGDWIGARILPNYKKQQREQLKDEVKLKVIDFGNVDDFNSIFTRLVSSKISISVTDKKDVEWFVMSYRDKINELPGQIPSKENIAFLLACFVSNNIEAEELFVKQVKTATDVLRIATAMSEGDISLAGNTRFKNFSQKSRKTLLNALENAGNITEDMLRYKNRWKRLGEKLHPFEYKRRFPKCFAAFDVIRYNKPFHTFNGMVENAIIQNDGATATNLLKSRPGELARRLDKLIRISPDNSNDLISVFREIAAKISVPVLLQVHCHFKNRNSHQEIRTFFPKGNIGKAKAIDNKLPNIDPVICAAIVSVCEFALVENFKKHKQLGKVYLDEKLKEYTVPFALRSASKSLTTISRGSRLDLPAGNTIRFFIYWKDGHDRTDLDLSALALDSDSGFKGTIAYYNLKESGGYHSGDITSAPDGASEFIDIGIKEFLERGIRYVLMSVNSYTNQQYCDLPVCFAGFMIRQFPGSGEIYEPQTVQNKFDLTANSAIAIPIIIDLYERKAIWVDLSLKNVPSADNNVHNNLSSVTIINKSMTTLIKPNLFDLVKLHIDARGERTLDVKEANTIFAVDNGIKPSDIDILVSEYI